MPSYTQAPLPYVGPLIPRPADSIEIGRPGRVSVIAAAAGYGKSVLINQWTQKNQDRSILWFNAVRRYDTRDVLLGFLQEATSISGVDFPAEFDLANPEAIADLTIRCLTALPQPAVLVIDGLHHLRGHDDLLQESLRIFIERQPRDIAIVIVTRNSHLSGIEIARHHGRLDYVGESDLKIDQEEFVRVLLQRGVSNSAAHEMYRLILGWPVAAGLILGSTSIPSQIEDLRLSVISGGMIKFLTDAILSELPREIREALLVTSIAEVLSADLAIALGLSPQQAGALLDLSRFGVPVIHLTPSDYVSVNDLFRHQMLRTLRGEQPQRERELRRLYANYLVDHNDPRAIGELIAIGDLERAKSLFDGRVIELIEAGHVAGVTEWMQALETQLEGRSAKLKQQIYIKMIEADYVLTESLLDSLKDEMAQFSSGDDFSWAFYHLACAWLAVNAGDLDELLKQARVALAVSEGLNHDRKEEYLDTARSYLAVHKIFLSSPSEGDPEIQSLFTGANELAVLWREVTHPSFRSHIAAQRGEFRRAELFGRQAIEATPHDLNGSIYFPWPALTGLVISLREQGQAERTVELVEQYQEEIYRLHPVGYAIEILSTYAAALADLGRTQEATDSFSRLRQLVEKYGRGWWVNDRLDFHEARYLLRHGDESRAAQLASRIRDPHALPILTLHTDIESAPRRAAQTLSTMRRESPADEMTFRLFSALLHKNHPEQADQHLRHLLALMEENGAVRQVIDTGRDAVALVSVYVARHNSRYGESLVTRMQEAMAMATSSGLIAPLSKREQQILGMLASSMSLKELADALFVSQNTLKTHLRNLYRKMQVGGRDQAVQQGKKLLLLP